MRFIGNEPGNEELTVQSVRVGNTFRETSVVVKKGTETGEIKFKEDSLNTPPPAITGPGGARGPTAQGQFPKPGGAPMSPQMNAMNPTRLPQTNAVPQPVPRPQGSVPQPTNMPQPVGAPKGRLRVINN